MEIKQVGQYNAMMYNPDTCFFTLLVASDSGLINYFHPLDESELFNLIQYLPYPEYELFEVLMRDNSGDLILIC